MDRPARQAEDLKFTEKEDENEEEVPGFSVCRKGIGEQRSWQV